MWITSSPFRISSSLLGQSVGLWHLYGILVMVPSQYFRWSVTSVLVFGYWTRGYPH
jgi:hypothetical protein